MPVLKKLLLISFILGGILYFVYEKHYTYTQQNTKVVYIPKGSSLKYIGEILKRAKIIESSYIFLLTAYIGGMQNKLQAGEFFIPKKYNIKSLIDILAYGKPIVYKIIIPEGLTKKQIYEILQENEILLGDISINYSEGELFPDTYHFHRGEFRDNILKKMFNRMQEQLDKVWSVVKQESVFKNKKELLILASIIEKEFKKPEQAAIISSVFHNRLRLKMPLQSNPTIEYGLRLRGLKANDPPTIKEIKFNTPYNTYFNKGLPLGPICSPGQNCLLAAAKPASTKYLYFVSDGVEIIFSKKFKNHNKQWQAIKRKLAVRVD